MRIEGIAGGANPLLRYSRILTSMRTSVVNENGLGYNWYYEWCPRGNLYAVSLRDPTKYFMDLNGICNRLPDRRTTIYGPLKIPLKL